MHFKTLVLAGLTSLAAVAALPSASRHDSPMAVRHHRFIRPRKADPVSSKVKRCAATSSSASEAAESIPASAEYTPAEAGNAAAKPTTTARTRSAKFVTSTVKSSTKTQSETESEPAAPTAITGGGGGTGGISISDKLLAVFPGGTANGMPKWSTNPAVSGAFALSDKALGATSVITRLSHPVVNFAGKQAMKISFQKGAVAYRSKALGGVSFYALGPSTQRIDNAKVLTFSYSINFQEGFDFNKGGKLPGLYGGTSEDEARGCSGGNTRPTCWSARFMWREKGAGELYGYLPSDAKPTNKAAVCSKTNTSCDLGYGWSLGRDTWEWTPGSWQTIAQKVTLNDIGKANGSVIVYMNGKEVYAAKNIMLRTKKNAMPRGVMFQSFFGGHDPSWASPKDQELHIADLSVAVLETE